MIIIKGDGFTIKRKSLPLCDVFSILNELCDANIIKGYDVDITRVSISSKMTTITIFKNNHGEGV